MNYDQAVELAKTGVRVRCEAAGRGWWAYWKDGQMWWVNPVTEDARPFDIGRDATDWIAEKSRG